MSSAITLNHNSLSLISVFYRDKMKSEQFIALLFKMPHPPLNLKEASSSSSSSLSAASWMLQCFTLPPSSSVLPPPSAAPSLLHPTLAALPRQHVGLPRYLLCPLLQMGSLLLCVWVFVCVPRQKHISPSSFSFFRGCSQALACQWVRHKNAVNELCPIWRHHV